MRLVCGPRAFDLGLFEADLKVELYSVATDTSYGFAGHEIAKTIRRRKLSPQPRAWDFLSIALSCLCADMAGHRKLSPDGWTREFELTVAVTDPDFWDTQKLLLEETLSFLTTDRWVFEFVEGGYYPRPARPAKKLEGDCLTLLSGGLDSLIGTIDLVSDGFSPVTISQVVRGDRANQELFPKLVDSSLTSVIMSHTAGVPNGETPASQRSRSIIFLAYGALLASSIDCAGDDHVPFFVSENGFISLNPPLTPMRVGSLSTRTTHPTYLSRIQRVFNAANIPLRIENRYALKTKGEMLLKCKNPDLIGDLASRSTSCGRYLTFNYTHCGRCVPCLVRRAAFFKWDKVDNTGYLFDDIGRSGPYYSGFDDVRAVSMAILDSQDIGVERWMGANLSASGLGNQAPYTDLVARSLEELRVFLDYKGVR